MHNLIILTLSFDCLEDDEQMDALLYLRDILQDVTSQTTRITGINMRFRIMLEPSFTDHEGLVHLNWAELHPLFTHAVWTDIARALADLSHKSLKEFWIILFFTAQELESGSYRHEVGPINENTLVGDVIGPWLRDSLIQGAGFKEGVEFRVVGML